jgi:hypothetical protein
MFDYETPDEPLAQDKFCIRELSVYVNCKESSRHCE